MEITLTTPALLFPAISLLLLAYTNRFLALAGLIRSLKQRYATTQSHIVYGQIENLRTRLLLIRNMQAFGIASIFGCVFCMFVLFAGYETIGKYVFGLSLLLLLISLALALREIQISVHALTLELNDLEEETENS
ncbi:DUF2721 domain-containing protein [Pontibacter sp. BT310]|jgi:hypothetical protein|uniref:DUF2721 domain-containing protein n=1 Tax=Pontibacter populi TaxID=890055 RepID=A0ABS6X737_9BACT|nr:MULTISPECIES: DUF2721 domain-containing protein [Pontibacter]MBJ6116946.1 DUF2721 domain-containing protein [Pontibacter sp. BT310]MBR0569370.1 DUF2721 domain-containing protein [Microvirga sp. STS03]MBW3363799.1 DUF2721 domain-containing protein [Pontibacter populi]